MLTLAVIIRNPLADAAVTWFGVGIVLLIVAIFIVGLVLAIGHARSDGGDGPDPAFEALRRRRLVVLRPRKPRGPEATVVSELDPAGDSKPAAR